MKKAMPTIAAQWIATVVLPSCNIPAECFEQHGLAVLKGTSNSRIKRDSSIALLLTLTNQKCCCMNESSITTVRDLKAIRNAIRDKGRGQLKHSIPGNSNKRELILSLHKAFYVDDSSTVENKALLAQLQGDLHGASEASGTTNCPSNKARQPTGADAASTPRTSNSNSSRKRKSHQMAPVPIMPYPMGTQQVYSSLGGRGIPNPFSMGLNPDEFLSNVGAMQLQMQMQQMQHSRQRGFQPMAPLPPRLYAQVHNPSLQQLRRENFTNHPLLLPTSSATPSTGASAVPNDGTASTNPDDSNDDNAATAASSDDDAIFRSEQELPLNPQESMMLSQLVQMGFRDRDEVVRGIRQSNKNSADAIMMWLIQEKENADEASKMDEARKRSEELRAENAIKKKQAEQERLDAANTRESLQLIFTTSWVLKHLSQELLNKIVGVKKLKESLLRLLKIEKMAIKWYKSQLPSCYFKDLCRRIHNENDLVVWFQKECDALEAGLYMLEEQQGGVPKLFLRATAAHPEDEEDAETGKAGEEKKSDDDDDDEIEVIGVRVQPQDVPGGGRSNNAHDQRSPAARFVRLE